MSDVLTLADFKAWAHTELSEDDNLNDAAINAATSLLGSWTKRNLTLVTDDTAATPKTFRPASHCTDVLWLDGKDAASIVSVVENGATLADGVGYLPEPYGNENDEGAWRPFDRLYRLNSWWYWDGRRRTVTVTAKWGWTTFDPLIGEACKVLAQDWTANRNATFGVSGISPEGFSIGMRDNPLVRQAVAAVRGPQGFGIA